MLACVCLCICLFVCLCWPACLFVRGCCLCVFACLLACLVARSFNSMSVWLIAIVLGGYLCDCLFGRPLARVSACVCLIVDVDGSCVSLFCGGLSLFVCLHVCLCACVLV